MSGLRPSTWFKNFSSQYKKCGELWIIGTPKVLTKKNYIYLKLYILNIIGIYIFIRLKPPRHRSKFRTPAGKQLSAGVQKPPLSGLTDEFAKKYSSGEKPSNFISWYVVIVSE